jgi:RNA polymerase sigma-70 factor (ECF subfamily)
MGAQAIHPDPPTEELLARAGAGDAAARNRLLDAYRARLRALVALRLPRRLSARVDPSDVVQETLAAADGRLADYLARRPLPYYLWLRDIALERLIDLQRRHGAQKRSVRREEPAAAPLADESMCELADRLAARGSSPSQGAQREELRHRVRQALDRLGERDREVLVLRHLEQMSTREIAAVLGLSESAVKVRHLRALQRLRELLRDRSEGPA